MCEELRRKGWASLKGPKQKGIGLETGTFWDSLESPTVWTVLVLWGRGCFIVAGLSTESVVLVSIRTGRDSFPVWRNVSLSWLRERIGKSPCSSSDLHHWELGGRWEGWLEGWRHLKPGKRSMKLWKTFNLSLIVCLPQLLSKSYFAERQF